MSNGTLSSRAWVCQERLLSKRNLHFGPTQVFWECPQHAASETFPKGFSRKTAIPHLKSELPKVSFPRVFTKRGQLERLLDTRAIWDQIVKMYMKANLTYRTDRLVAIGGLAAAARQSIGGKYLAGLWENHLPSSFLWATLDVADSSVFTVSPVEAQAFIAPSWSWASLNAEINLPQTPSKTGEMEAFCQILETHIELASDDVFGQVCSGSIKVKGELAPARYHNKPVSFASKCNDSVSRLPFEKIIY